MGLTEPREPRAISLLLMIGLVALPIVFVWVLLLPGYSASLRKVAFVYAFGPFLVAWGALVLMVLAGTAQF